MCEKDSNRSSCGDGMERVCAEPCDTDSNTAAGAQTIANKTSQRQKETDARRKPKGLRQNPSGRNRTSDQLISKNTDTQYSTLQSIALPTELHSVVGSYVSTKSYNTLHKLRYTQPRILRHTEHHISHAALVYHILRASVVTGRLI